MQVYKQDHKYKEEDFEAYLITFVRDKSIVFQIGSQP